MPGLGDAGVQKTLKGIISKSSKEQHRYEREPRPLTMSNCELCTMQSI